MMYRIVLLTCLATASALLGAADDGIKGVPFKPDPPFAIDGELGDWADVPGAYSVKDAKHVISGRGAWTAPADQSGTVRLAWRHENLFVAADVTDDQLRQSQRGDGIWEGDHIELYLDAQPDLEPARDLFGRGQFHFAFSPGNFLKTGDALADCTPETYCFKPAGASVKGVKVGAKRTAAGWTVEAAVPWALLGIRRPDRGMTLRFEIALSDTDTPEAKQESMMTTSTARWRLHARSRLTLAALAGSDGVAPAVVRRIPIFEVVRLPRGKKKALTFTAPAIPPGRDAALVLNARLHTPKVAGHHPALHLTLNGTALSGKRFLNKPMRVPARGGPVYSMAAGEYLTTYYSPDFRKPDLHPYYGLLKGVKACDFELRVTDLLRKGKNELMIANRARPHVEVTLVAANARIEFRVPPPPEKQRRPAPTGPVPVIEPRRELVTHYQVEQQKGKPGLLRLQAAGRTFDIRSRFSTPEPKWTTASNRYFRHQRRIEKKREAIVVYDTFTNLTSRNLPIMQRHEIVLGETLKQAWLGGLRRSGRTGSVSQPANPTGFGATTRAGIGLLALGDVMRQHAANYALNGTLGLADNSLALKPGATYTAEWAIVPADKPDYWRFINAVRRLVDANFTIDGGFCFFRAAPWMAKAWTDEQTRNFIKFKDAKYVCSSIYSINGMYAHGTRFQQVSHERYIREFKRRSRLVPGVKNLIYFHCFINPLDDAPTRYADARVLRPDGSQADYGAPYWLFFPTDANSYGPAIAKNVDVILDKIGADGVYWDEHEYSAYRYHCGRPWDGVSCDIDPKTMNISRLKSSVTLLTEKWRVAMAKRILARGPLIANGVPYTKAMAALKFPCFTETGGITNCARNHLYSPIALGDHLTERSEEDAYGVMLAALDYGCVYHWYNDVNVIPTHHHLTRYMYPITPMELHAGYIIGKERIITKTSGLFSWGDASEHEVHVFDHTGREVENTEVPLVRRDGKTYREVRLAEGCSAAIVRK